MRACIWPRNTKGTTCIGLIQPKQFLFHQIMPSSLSLVNICKYTYQYPHIYTKVISQRPLYTTREECRDIKEIYDEDKDFKPENSHYNMPPKLIEKSAKSVGLYLSPLETKLFNLLKDVRAHFGLNTNVRVAGGWVRDKLWRGHDHLRAEGEDNMQLPDIDITLDDMTGEQFGKYVVEYLQEASGTLHDTHSILEEENVDVIRSNPSKSKHLETANIHLFGLSVDFVNLRGEDYCENSRVPHVMRFGTPLEDALRRDVTINALFYNVLSETVEDWTGRGLDDIREGVLRAASPNPHTCLKDDPLRALRIIRFSCRFDMQIDPYLADALASPSVNQDIKNKVSVERVNKEVELMMGTNSVGVVTRAFTAITQYGWADAVFALPVSSSPPLQSQSSSLSPLSHTYPPLYTPNLEKEALRRVHVFTREYESLSNDTYKRKVCPSINERNIGVLAAYLSPLVAYKAYHPVKHAITNAQEKRVIQLLKDYRKYSGRRAASIARVIRASTQLQDIILPSSSSSSSICKGDAGVWVENAAPSHTRPTVDGGEGMRVECAWLLAALVHMASNIQPPNSITHFISFVQRSVLPFVSKPPLLTGEEVMEAGGVDAGPYLGSLIAQLRWHQIHLAPTLDKHQARILVKRIVQHDLDSPDSPATL